MAYKYVLYEKKGRMAFVTINRPEVLNALHWPASEELYDIWGDFLADTEVWTAVLTGAGDRSFCAGADIKFSASLKPEERARARSAQASDSRIQFGGMVHREIWKPIIAAVNGYCLGGGLEIAMSCDIIVASERARFGVPEIRNVGGFPGAGGIHRLPRHIPLKTAMLMLLTGDHMTAEEALRTGLVSRVVPHDRLMAEATAIAERINENPPVAARVTKEIVTKSLDLPLEYPDNQGLRAWDLDALVGMKLWESEDWQSREGPRAFVEKRKPIWKGR